MMYPPGQKPLHVIRDQLFRISMKVAAVVMEDFEWAGELTEDELRQYERELERFDQLGWMTDPTAWNRAKDDGRLEGAKNNITIIRAVLPLVQKALKLTNGASHDDQARTD